ncbi:MAG TPA: helix-turn-helix domain-containing protein [Spirochaetota bacterium]|nr:helix-turn-helix domain-containing protein [Spirochaetota bacterium]HPU89154.1 helix-turn-helix domain-containing protein [Spirochaetota bacterium]
MKNPVKQNNVCPLFEAAFDILGKKWTGLILRVLSDGPKRFGDLSGTICNMSDRMLIERLKELEAMNVVSRKVYDEIPVRIEYELTEKGKAFKPVLDEIQKWASEWCK